MAITIHTVTAHLRDNRDGSLHLYTCPVHNDNLQAMVFWWTEGNFGCDCNRINCLSGHDTDEDDEEVPCGDGVLVTLEKLIDDDTGADLLVGKVSKP